MTRRNLLPLLASGPLAAQMLMMGETSEGFVSLFNGQDIEQWEGDPKLWRVERGVLTGSTEDTPALKADAFLVYQPRRYRDFELRLDIRVHKGNSGVRFREGQLAPAGAEVRGFQAQDWNEYRISCKGAAVRITLNGAVIDERADPAPKAGTIGLRLSAGTPMRVDFRNIRINAYD